MQEEGEQQTHTELPKVRDAQIKKILRKQHYLPRHAPRHKMKSKQGHRAGELIFSPRCARPAAGSRRPSVYQDEQLQALPSRSLHFGSAVRLSL